MQVNSREIMPEEFLNSTIENLPPKYQDPIYICPNSIQLNVYTSSKEIKEPLNLNKLIDECNIDERIYMNMYPGGAAMEVLQYKRIYDSTLRHKWIKASWIPQYFADGQKSKFKLEMGELRK